jgi:hypothetical protein
MPAYIIIDAWTGYIWADTRDFSPLLEYGTTPAEACRIMDEGIGTFGQTYREVPRLNADTGYIIHRADVEGSEAVSIVHDGQSAEEIAAVRKHCPIVAYVEWDDPQD